MQISKDILILDCKYWKGHYVSLAAWLVDEVYKITWLQEGIYTVG